MQRNVVNVAIIGMGTVGTGVVKVLINNQENIARKVGANIKIKKVLDKNSESVLPKIESG